jgi:hypothetical protein
VISSDGDNVFILDYGASIVRQVIRSTGIISTLTGTTGGVLYFPWGIWGDSIGNLFIADTNHYQIKKLSLFYPYTLSTIAGTGGNSNTGFEGNPMSASFSIPTNIWGDSNGLYLFIVDRGANKIRIIDNLLNIIYTTAGTGTASPSSPDGLPANSTNINGPYAIWGNTAGNIFITEYLGNKAKKLYLPPSPSSQPTIKAMKVVIIIAKAMKV